MLDMPCAVAGGARLRWRDAPDSVYLHAAALLTHVVARERSVSGLHVRQQAVHQSI